jgi:hypothetical protein
MMQHVRTSPCKTILCALPHIYFGSSEPSLSAAGVMLTKQVRDHSQGSGQDTWHARFHLLSCRGSFTLAGATFLGNGTDVSLVGPAAMARVLLEAPGIVSAPDVPLQVRIAYHTGYEVCLETF